MDNLPAAQVDIWNLALDLIGENEPVESPTEERLAAEVCRRHYGRTLKQALSAYPWAWASKQSALSTPAGVTRTGWDYVYALPADCVRPVALLADGERISLLDLESRHPFAIMLDDTGHGHLLCCDLDASADDFEVLEYTALAEYIPIYPGAFVDALAYALASPLAAAVKKDRKMAVEHRQMARLVLAQAWAEEQNSLTPDVEQTTPSIAARG